MIFIFSGMSFVLLDPIPSSPLLLCPNAQIVPSDFSTDAKSSPADTTGAYSCSLSVTYTYTTCSVPSFSIAFTHVNPSLTPSTSPFSFTIAISSFKLS